MGQLGAVWQFGIGWAVINNSKRGVGVGEGMNERCSVGSVCDMRVEVANCSLFVTRSGQPVGELGEPQIPETPILPLVKKKPRFF